jgi:hypothetical protein
VKVWWAIACGWIAVALVAAAAGHDLFRVRGADDVAGQRHAFAASRDVRAVAFVFLGTECPVSQKYIPELNRIAKGHTNGVQMFGVISSQSTTRAEAAEFIRDYAVRFPVLYETNHALARWLRPTHVPHAFVLTREGDIMYRGRIDDAFAAPGKPRAVVRQRELRDALAAVVAGKRPAKPYAPPVGCYFESAPAAR